MTISKERVIEIAREAGIAHTNRYCDGVTEFATSSESITRFAQAIRNEALEEAAIEFENHLTEHAETISKAIRNLKEQQ